MATTRKLSTKMRLRGYAMKNRTLKNCPSGYIKRAAFVRYTKKGKHSLVREQCIHNVGSPGKGFRDGPGIGPLRHGELMKHGYAKVVDMTVAARHKALDSAVKEFGSLTVWRKLNAIAVYTKRTAPHSSKIFKADMAYIRSKYGVKAN